MKSEFKYKCKYKNKKQEDFMKTKMITKLSPLFVALSIASSNLYAGELTSYSSEIEWNDVSEDGSRTISGTLADGTYKINDTFKVNFEIIKHYVSDVTIAAVEDDDGNETAAAYVVDKEYWANEVSLVQSVGTVAGMDLSLYYMNRFNKGWEAPDGANSYNKSQYIFAPVFQTSYNIADDEYYFVLELWAQVGEIDGGSLQDYSGFEANFYTGGAISENLSLDLALYNFHYYEASADEYQYNPETEITLTYSLPLNENISLELEGSLIADYYEATELSTASFSVTPTLDFEKKMGEKYALTASVSLELASFSYSDTPDTNSSKAWDTDNTLSVSVGFDF